MRFDKNSDSLPSRSDLPKIDGAPNGAAWFWGKDDEVLKPSGLFLHCVLIDPIV